MNGTCTSQSMYNIILHVKHTQTHSLLAPSDMVGG